MLRSRSEVCTESSTCAWSSLACWMLPKAYAATVFQKEPWIPWNTPHKGAGHFCMVRIMKSNGYEFMGYLRIYKTLQNDIIVINNLSFEVGWKFMGQPPDLRVEKRICAIQNCNILVGSIFSYKPIWGDSGVSCNFIQWHRFLQSLLGIQAGGKFHEIPSSEMIFPTDSPSKIWAFRLPARFGLVSPSAGPQNDSETDQNRTALSFQIQQKDGSREDEETTSGSLNPTNPSPQPVPKHYKYTQ